MIKIRKPQGPSFNKGEVWISANGTRVTVVRVFKDNVTTNFVSDWNVTYLTGEGFKTHTKDCWSFQCRYNHTSDMIGRKP